MKKSLLVVLGLILMLGISSGFCFAGDADEVQIKNDEPVVLDQDYPEWGFRAHSWITGSGSNTIAHTQIIDRVTGTVIIEKHTKCGYTDPEPAFPDGGGNSD